MGGEKKALVEFTMMKQLKKNYALLPIVFIGIFGLSLSAFQITRTLSKSPDVKLNRLSADKPYEKYLKDGKHVQYKYFATMDYNKLEVDPDRPNL